MIAACAAFAFVKEPSAVMALSGVRSITFLHESKVFTDRMIIDIYLILRCINLFFMMNGRLEAQRGANGKSPVLRIIAIIDTQVRYRSPECRNLRVPAGVFGKSYQVLSRR